MLAAALALLPAAAFAQFTITRTSSPIFYKDNQASLAGMYVSYEITNTSGTTYPDVWVGIGSFTGPEVSLAVNEDGVQHFGAMAPGQTKMAYFYLDAAGATNSPESHTVTVYGAPPPSSPITSSVFTFARVENTIAANANKVTLVVSGPNPASLGGIVTVTVSGETGSLGGSNVLAFTPASYFDWPANVFELFSTTITMGSPNAGVITDSLYYVVPNSSNTVYQATYQFRITAFTSTPTAVSPVGYISSGSNIKHTKTTNFGTFDPIQPPQNFTTLTKVANPAMLLAGGTTTYTIHVANSGPNDLSVDNIMDVMPAGVTFVPGSATYAGSPLANPAQSGQTLTWNRLFAVPANSTVDLTYQATLPNAGATYVNNATSHIGTTLIDRTLATNDSLPATATVYVQSANLSIAKTSLLNPAVLNQNYTYRLVITNPGPDSARAVTVRDTLPAGVAFVSVTSSTGSASQSGGIVTANLGTRPLGSSDTVTIVAKPVSMGTKVNSATVTSTTPDPSSANNVSSVSTSVVATDAILDKRHTSAFTVGQNGTYTLVVTNAGTTPTPGTTTVTDTIPTGLTYVSAAGTGWSFVQSGQFVTASFPGVIAAGDSAKFTLTVSIAQAAFPSVTNRAMARMVSEADSTNNRDTDVTAITGAPDKAIDKRHTTGFTVGQNGTYTLVVRNAGTAVTVGTTTVTDTLPTGLTYVSGAGTGWTIGAAGQIVTATNAAVIAAGDSIQFTLTVAVTPAAFPSVINAATVSGAPDVDATNDRDLDPTAVAGVPDLSIDKRHTSVFTVGQNGTYRMVLKNLGTATTSGVTTVTDTLPTGLSLVSNSGVGWAFSQSGQIVTATTASVIAPGDSSSFTLTVNVQPSAFPAVSNAASLSTAGDLDPANNRDVDPTAINGAPNIALDKRHTSAFTVGQTGTFTLAVTNPGTGATTGATTVVDTLPAGTSFQSGSGAGWSFAQSGGIVTATHAGAIAAGDSAVFTLTVNVAPAAFPAISNSAVASTTGDLDPSDNRDVDAVTIIGVPDVAMQKRHTGSFTVGQNDDYTLVVTNPGTAATSGVITVTDTLPAGLTYVSGLGAGWSISASGQIVTATSAGPIVAGDSSAFTLTVSIAPAAFPSVTNSAVVNTAGDLDPNDNRATDATSITGVPDVSMQKRHSGAFVVGQTGSYTLVVTNPGTAATSGVTTVTDTLPTGLSYVSGSGAGWGVSAIGQIVTATHAGAIAAGDSSSFTITVGVLPAAFPLVTNSATVETPGDLDPTGNIGSDPTTITGAPELALEKHHAAPFTVGQDGVYSLVVRNLGNGATTAAITVVDTLPTGMTYVAGSGSGWSFSQSGSVITATNPGPIAAADSSNFTLTVHVAKAAFPSQTNAADVSSAGDYDGSDDRGTDPTSIIGVPDLAIDKRHTNLFTVAADENYTIVVTNVGTDVTAGAATVTDTLPNGLTFVSATGAGWAISNSGQIVTAVHAGTFAINDSSSFTLTVHVLPAAFPIVTNSASVESPLDVDLSNNRDSDPTLMDGVPDIALDKRHTGSFTVGQNDAYTITVMNIGTAGTAGAVTVTDTLPAGLTYVSTAGPAWTFSQSGQIVTATYAGGMAGGDSASFTLTVHVTAAAFPSVTNTAVANTTGDPDPSNDRDSDPTSITGVPDVALDKRHTADFTVGQNGSYDLVVTNLGTAVTGAVTVTDTLPAGLTFVSGSGTGWAVSAVGQVVTATNAGPIAANDSSAFTLTVSVSPAAFPAVTNSGVVATAGDLDPANNRDSDPTTVGGSPELALDKRHTADFVVGQNDSYDLVVTNLGSAAATSVTVTDTLPTGLTFVSGTGTGWTVSAVGQVVTATNAGPIAASDSSSFTLTVAVAQAAFPAVTNSATVATAGDYVAADDRDSDPTTVVGKPDVTLDKRHTANFIVGQNASYDLVVTNLGTFATGVVTVTDTLPAGLTFVSGVGTGWSVSSAGQIVTATNGGPIAAGDSSAFTLTVSVGPPAFPAVTNSATAVTAGDVDLTNDADSDPTAVQGSPELTLDKRHVDPFVIGQDGTYTLVVTNLGTAASGAITVTDTLPSGLTFAAGSGASWSFSTSGSVVTATSPGPIVPGDSSSFTLTVSVAPAAFPATINSADVASAGDYDPADNRDSDSTAVTGVPDLALDKRHTAPFVVGQNGSYTLVVSNVGYAVSGIVTVTDTLPAGLTYVSATGAGWAISQSGPVVTATHAGGIAANDSSSFLITTLVTPAAFPGVVNSATLGAAVDLDPSNNRDTDSTSVAGSPDLALDKRHTSDFTVGQNGSYDLVVTNLGTNATGVVTVTDTLPTGLAFVNGSGSGWSVSAAGPIVTATHAGPIAVSDSASFTLTVSVAPAAFPAVTNSATAATAGDYDAANDSDSDPTTVIGVPDVALDKRHAADFVVGQNDSYDLVVTNLGTLATGVVTVTDTLPAGLTFVSGTGTGWTVSAAGQIVTATHAGPIAVSDSASFTLTASVAPAAFPAVTNSADVTTANDLDPANNRDSDPTTVVGVPDVALDKRHTAAFTVGLNGSYDLVVRNLGTDATGVVTVTDTLPAGLTFVSGAGTAWTVSASGPIVTATHGGPIAAGDSSAFTLTVAVGAPAFPAVTNSATVATAGDLDPANNTDSDPTAITGSPDASIDKRHAAVFTVGQNGTYDIVVTNRGSAATGAITVTDALPAGLAFVSGTGTGWTISAAGQVVTATNPGPVAAGDSSAFTLTVAVLANSFPVVTNSATVATANDYDPTDDTDADVTTITGAPNAALDKRHVADFVVGQNGSYDLVVTNIGTSDVGAMTVTDTLPAGLTFVSGTGTGWAVSAVGQVVTATNPGPLAVDDSTSFTLTVSVAQAAFPAVTNSATVATAGDYVAADDRDSDPTTVVGKPDVALDKRHTANFVVGQNDSYDLVVTNLGTFATGVVTVTDTLPSGLTFMSGAGTGWSVSSAGQIVTASHGGPIAAGDSSAFTLTVSVGPPAFPAVTNSATAATAGDIDLANNADSDPTTVTGVPDLALDKRHSALFVVASNGTYDFAITNLGTAATTGAITVTDTLPAGLTFVSGAGTGWTVSASGPIVTATNPGPIAAGDSSKFTLTVAVGAAGFPLVTNSADVATANDLDPSNNRDTDPTLFQGVPDLALDKRHSTALQVGQNATYTIALTNVGTAATTAVTTVVDTLPLGLTFVSGTGAGWTVSASGQIVTATNPNPIPGADSSSFTITVGVSAPAFPAVTNSAVVSTAGDPNAANDRDTDPATVIGTPDLALDKRHTAPFTVGQNGTYDLVVTNLGTTASGVATVTDTLPNGMTFVSGSGAGWTVSAAGPIVTATHAGPIAAGDSSAVALVVGVGPGAFSAVTNSATVSTAGDLDPTNNRDSDPTSVNGAPELAMEKRHAGSFTVGTNGSYNLIVVNQGQAASSSVTVTDTLPSGLGFVSAAGTGWTITNAGQIVTAIHAGPIANSDSALFVVTVSVAAPAIPSVTNSATVASAGDYDPSDDRASDPTVVVGVVDLAMAKRHTGSFTVGTNGTYTLTVHNVGSTASGAVTVTDALPAGLSFVSGTGTGWTVSAAGALVTATNPGPVAAGDSSSFTLTVGVAPPAVPGVTNTASLTTPGDVDTANNVVSDPTTVNGVVDLAMAKTHAGAFTVGTNGTYTLSVRNVGSAASGAVSVADTLPAGLTYVSGSGTGWTFTPSGSIVTVTNPGPIAAGDSATFTLTVAVNAAGVPGVTNSATLSTGGDVDAANDRASDPTVINGVVDLAMEKTHSGTFTAGTNGTYTLKVVNFGTGASGAVAVADTLPAGLAFVSGSGAGWTISAAGPIVTATNAGPIAAGDSSAFTLTVSVAASAVPGVTNSATLVTAGDVDAANDHASDPTIVNGVVDLAMAKRHAGPFTVGTNGSYTLTVTNLGSAASGAVAVSDTLPAGLGYVAGAGAGWTFAQSGSIVTATNAGPIAAGDSSAFTLTVSVAAPAVPGVTNSASLVTAGDINAGNDRASDPTVVNGIVDLAMYKRHTGSFTAGTNGMYTLTVRNLGSAASGSVAVTDSLPSGLTYVSSVGAGWTITTAGQIVTATNAGPIAVGDSAFFTITVAVGPTAVPAVTNAASLATAGDLDAINDRASDLTAVIGGPDLAMHKRHAGSFTVNQSGVYTLTVTNHGQSATTGVVTVTDSLPAGLTYIGASGSGWTISTAGPLVTATNPGPIAAGDSASFTLTVDVGLQAAPSVSNSALVATAGDAGPADNRAVDIASVNGQGVLAVEKSANKTEVEVGDFVDYSVSIRNVGTGPLLAVSVDDQLPTGLRYQPGSARLDGAIEADPAGSPGPALHFQVGNVLANSSHLLTYRVYVGAGAELGSGTNFAVARTLGDSVTGSPGVTSNTGAAKITIQRGLFSDLGTIVGKLFVSCDCDSDRVQGIEELGIPGVRVVLEDGTSAITDAEGKYHFEAVRPRLHVIRIDATTLPQGARMVPDVNRNALDGLSQFVDLKQGEFHRADFIEMSRSADVLAAVKARRALGEVHEIVGLDNRLERSGMMMPDSLGDGVVSLERARGVATPLSAALGYSLPGGSPQAMGTTGVGMGGAWRDENRVPGVPPSAAPPRASLLLLGLIEARLDWRSLTTAKLNGASRDRFEDELKDLAFDSNDGQLTGGARGALFVKGTMVDSVGVTLRYDSEHDPDHRLFRDIRPLEGYDAFGDASTSEHDGQSNSRLYARFERGRSFAQFGDFVTPAEPERRLGAFMRSLNGGLARWESGHAALGAFVTEADQHQVIDEVPAMGISGPYAMSHTDGAIGSEVIEVITRDRNQPNRILRREPKLRFVDYTIEPFTGRILFRRAIPSVDEDLNPISIRMTYESVSGDKFWMYGAQGKWAPNARVAAGAAFTHDDDPLASRDVASVNGVLGIASGVSLTGEFARSDSGGTGIGAGDRSGEAGRAGLHVDRKDVIADAFWMRVAAGFQNPSAGVLSNREEIGVNGRIPLGARTALFGEALRTQDLGTKARRNGFDAGIHQAFGALSAEAGYRWADGATNVNAGTADTLANKVSAVHGKLSLALPIKWKSSVFGEFEQDLVEQSQRRTAVGGDIQLTEHTRAYVRHENIASFNGTYALNTVDQRATTVLGLASDELPSGQIFTEYRMRDAFGGRETQAAIGVRNRWTVVPGFSVDGSVERVSTLRGGTHDAGTTAVATGFEYSGSPLWRGTGQFEMRSQSSLETYLAAAGVARKLNRDWSALGNTTWFLTPDDQDKLDARSQVGIAFRQTDANVWNGLARYENRFQRQGGPTGYRKVANIVAGNADWHPAERWLLNGGAAAKWAHDDRAGLPSKSSAVLSTARVLYDFTTRFDMGLIGRSMASGAKQWGAGAELGWLAAKNFRVAAGYNAFGFRDQDLAGADRTDQGPYFTIGVKFDEGMFRSAGSTTTGGTKP